MGNRSSCDGGKGMPRTKEENTGEACFASGKKPDTREEVKRRL